jgi:dTDP-4-amino-4,6-dideoxygalactose transaminase
MVDRDRHAMLGYNYRMSDLNGAIGTVQVDRLAGFNERRAEISQRLFDELDGIDWLEPATIRPYAEHAYFWAPFEVDIEAIGRSGKQVWRDLNERGVETRHRYTTPLYKQPVFQNHRGFNSDFPWSENPYDHEYDLELPNAETVAGRTIGLPNHPNLTDEEIEFVVNTIRTYDTEL